MQGNFAYCGDKSYPAVPAMIVKTKNSRELVKLVLISVFIGLSCAVLGYSLKIITESAEHHFFHLAAQWPLLYFILPFSGLSAIFLLRQRLFHKKENKGMKEIFDSLKNKQNELPFYKVPSHYINGFLTVIVGGSTGIEVSTVVASATIGSLAHKKGRVHLAFRKELICAGVAAAVTVLFGSPVAGCLFCYEVISKKISKFSLLSMLLAVCTAWGFNALIQNEPLFIIKVETWHYYAIPYIMLLGVFAGLNSVYLTRCVLFFKKKVAALNQYVLKLLIATLLLGFSFLLFPELYGDGYHAMETIFTAPATYSSYAYPMLMLGSIVLLKPIVSAATLSGGGDGGVFAPSLFIGAFLGLIVAQLLNNHFDAGVIPVNFMVIGMAGVLSASLHAPFTSVFLVCGLAGNYSLLLPILLACLIARFTAKIIFPYTVYSYAVAVKPI